MGFVTRWMAPNTSLRQATQEVEAQATQNAQLEELRQAQAKQAAEIAAREARTKKVEDGQRAIRTGRRRGLLAYTGDEPMTLGGAA